MLSPPRQAWRLTAATSGFRLSSRQYPNTTAKHSLISAPCTRQAAIRQASIRQSSTATLFPSADLSTGERLSSFCQNRALARHSTPLHPPDFPEARLYTINVNPHARGGVLLYFHGGGYTHPAGPGHFKFATRLTDALRCKQLCVLEYTLLPRGVYPTQLAQAAASLKVLLREHFAADIAIAGDSAGGNLVLALLAHLRQAHPALEPLDDVQDLAAAICISPRCSNSTTSESFMRNADRDIINANTLASFVKQWKPKLDDVWAAADNGGRDFWSGAASLRAEKMFISVGDREVYLDDILDFTRMVDAVEVGSNPSASRQYSIAKDSKHVQCILDLAENRQDGPMLRSIFQWARDNPVMK